MMYHISIARPPEESCPFNSDGLITFVQGLFNFFFSNLESFQSRFSFLQVAQLFLVFNDVIKNLK